MPTNTELRDDKPQLTFSRLREINSRRSALWMRGVPWSLSDWMTALTGEVGEAANFIKKINRIDGGLVGNLKVEDVDRELLMRKLRKEVGDILLYTDLLAEQCGVTLEEVAIEVFNTKSEQLGFEERL